MVVADEGKEDGCVDAAVLLVLWLVLLDGADLEVLVGVAHLSQMPGDDGP